MTQEVVNFWKVGTCAIPIQQHLQEQWSRKLCLACRTICPAGLQCTTRHFESLSDIFPCWQLANISGHSRFPVRNFILFEPCWTKCPARYELSAGHQHKSAGHVWHVVITAGKVWHVSDVVNKIRKYSHGAVEFQQLLVIFRSVLYILPHHYTSHLASLQPWKKIGTETLI